MGKKPLQPDWEFVADTVMGGVSQGGIAREQVAERMATRLRGEVSLDNNGGFVQMAFDLAGGARFDASAYTGVEMDIFGNDELYDVRLRTDQLQRPWQSFRTEILAHPRWTTFRIPFADFNAHKTDAVFNPARLRRIGVLGIGREFRADAAVAAVGLYKA